jgi:hypothetical protein
MRGRHLAVFTLLLLLTSLNGGMSQSTQHRDSATEDEPSVQIVGIGVDPASVEKVPVPTVAMTTVTVKVCLTGLVPPGSAATVEVATFSAKPPRNNVRYENMKRLPLKSNPTVFQFKVYPSEQTVSGHLIIAASIIAHTPGITVKKPERPSDWRTRFDIGEP